MDRVLDWRLAQSRNTNCLRMSCARLFAFPLDIKHDRNVLACEIGDAACNPFIEFRRDRTGCRGKARAQLASLRSGIYVVRPSPSNSAKCQGNEWRLTEFSGRIDSSRGGGGKHTHKFQRHKHARENKDRHCRSTRDSERCATQHSNRAEEPPEANRGAGRYK